MPAKVSPFLHEKGGPPGPPTHTQLRQLLHRPPPHTEQDEHLRNQAAHEGGKEVLPVELLAAGPNVEELLPEREEDNRPEAELHAQGNGEEGGDNQAAHEMQPFVGGDAQHPGHEFVPNLSHSLI